MLKWISSRIVPLMLGFGAPVFAQPAAVPDIGPVAWQQIVAIQKEKGNWTPAQRKVDSHLVHRLKANRGQLPPILAGIPSHVKFEADGRVLVDIDADVTVALLRQIESSGGTIVASVPRFHSVRAQVPLEAVESLAALTNVTFVKQAVMARTRTGSVESEGDITHGAIGARTNFGVNGSGIKVGVLSDSVKNLSTSQSTGDLPTNVVVLPGQSGTSISGNEGEGTAMLEIVHDLAPGAQLYFATAFASEASFAQNILDLRSNGCNIIVDDVGYFDEPAFQDGIIAQSVNSVTADGALYFSSAGNGGRLDAGTGAAWEGDFVDGGPVGAPMNHGRTDETGGRLHNFGSATYDTIVGPTATYYVNLFWADPWGASTNDYDLFALNSSGSAVDDYSNGTQVGVQNPYEIVTAASAGDRIVVIKFSGASRFIHLELLANGYGTLAVSTPGDVRGHNAATNAFAVAAVDVHSAYPGLFNSSNTNEYFSSDGPRKMFFQANGAPITPGNFMSSGGAVRLKPDISAADGASNSVAGFNPFFGTSAAAPHAAAVAALLWSYSPSLTTSQMRAILTNTAIDIGTAGWDRDAGFGIVMPGAAIQSLIGGPTNHPPVLTVISNKVVNELSTLVFTNSATDPDTNAIVFSLDPGAPTNATINPASGVFTWTPTEAQGPSTNSITVRVTDNGIPALNATSTFSVTVLESNLPPALSSITSKTVLEGVTLAFTNTASDPDLPANALTYSLDPGAPTNAVINPTNGVFSWTPNEAQGPGTNTIVVRVTDNGTPSLSATQSFNVIIAETNQAPVLSAISGKTVLETMTLVFTNAATDADLPANALVYSLDPGAPTNAIINPATGVFSWTPNEAQGPGTNTIVVRVTDNGSPPLSATQSFNVIIAETNQAPVLSVISGKTVLETTPLVFTNAATDADLPANALVYSLDPGAPTNAVINPTNGIFAWTPAEGQGPSTNTVSVRVTDNGSPPLSATQSFTIVVLESNLAPALVPITDRVIHIGSSLVITNVATDPDLPANLLTFSLTNAPAGAVINPTNGVFTWTPDIAAANTTNNIAVQVTDNGNPPLSAVRSFSVTVVPPPSFLSSHPISFSNGFITISWSAIVGQTYRVQFNTDIMTTNWIDLVPDVTATNTIATKTDAFGPDAVRFYRVSPTP